MTMSRAEAGRRGHSVAREKLLAHQEQQHLEAILRWQQSKKLCEQCGTLLTYEQRRNRFCSRSCSAKANNGKRGPRSPRCRVCGKSTGDGRAQHCSRECAEIARYTRNVEMWISGEHNGGSWRGVSTFVRRWLLEQRGEQCWRCGWSEINQHTGVVPVQVHHRNGDPEDHSPSNLELLCPNCHALTKTYGARNKGNGRTKRYNRPR